MIKNKDTMNATAYGQLGLFLFRALIRFLSGKRTVPGPEDSAPDCRCFSPHSPQLGPQAKRQQPPGLRPAIFQSAIFLSWTRRIVVAGLRITVPPNPASRWPGIMVVRQPASLPRVLQMPPAPSEECSGSLQVFHSISGRPVVRFDQPGAVCVPVSGGFLSVFRAVSGMAAFAGRALRVILDFNSRAYSAGHPLFHLSMLSLCRP